MRAAPLNLLELTESEFDGLLFRSDKSMAKTLGWKLVYHVLHSKGSQPGFPDRVLLRERQIVAETKSETGKVADAQVAWLDGFARCGVETYLWRPSDFDDIGVILGRRWQAFVGLNGGHLLGFGGERWTPGSLWIPGRGRADTMEQAA